MKTNKPLISLKIVNRKGKKVEMVVSRKIKRIYSFLKAEKNRDCVFKLSVKYGKDCKNEGHYKNKQDLMWALKAFTEPD